MIYKSIAERLRMRIDSEDYAVGSPLPGEKRLAAEYGVSRMTIRKATDLLIEWGLVTRRHGSGTYIVRKDVHHEISQFMGFLEAMHNQGKEVFTEVLAFNLMPAPPAIASQLRIKVNERIYYSRRIRSVQGKPMVVEDSYMPARLFRNLSLAHLEGSKFSYIEDECHINIAGNHECLTPVLADENMAKMLNIEPETPILRITSLVYSDSGEFVNYSVMHRNARDYQVEYILRRNP
ncbi:GntR family transcriptional regulator [Affinibrenneria salicis]|uniref:GntR family transcriptional regulator n=1 Tax=Affinibrenneria salicis TaxID=2590031 RepID=A0A5J5FQQ3_9GAMM|nr:GntR family transcriptional regulator [Affinibrenneria salicis]KAA8994936.1 GntR family transcriptional regulator [Affinibrenneria salicis]